MKCVKSVKQTKQISLGEIMRVSDEDAIEKVKGGFWVYAPKSEWKGDKVSVKKDDNPKSTTTNDLKIKKGKSKKELKLEKKRNK